MSAFAVNACLQGNNREDASKRRVLNRRQLLRVATWSMPAVMGTLLPTTALAMTKSDAEWKKELPPDSYYVLRQAGTERPFTSPLNKEYGKGTYSCRGCSTQLFTSDTKFDSGTGWPSFYDALDGVKKKPALQDFLFGGTEVVCKTCEGHLGHVFKDGPKPTGLRYCINGVALKFESK
mmetsp:Transcript_2839/g.8675  ORF Transcript_2839/g.8675 Transcript_2839/m.8675 type:complete len:178 (+) Transcript_2839:769-1302(+)|eukprot:CAMPEP_0198726218 /NCGR_PEP_ID=MMETSP1475-20131203/3347_1 /TAXON_ID= ORGANISM="Unidentified sp., Strain CCMP1999" /NCGR_SAMPLE_ID=MMETSP1475 /ASSEMBLY_ACC=CAM_ASM_001111 /LENGTH=177 /DNA_ID=CAMNT_0044488121 /DNA_START=672 /DNA_END=1205 /DNA_ORIENTATION=+